jgi:hypothetical protein
MNIESEVTKEIWKDIPDYEGYYQVSNLGRIKSFSNKSKSRDRVLKYSYTNDGYRKVDLYKETKRKTYNIHQLVAIAFLNHVPNGTNLVIDHINHNKEDNRVYNLRVVSNQYNLSRSGNKKSGRKPSVDHTDYKGVYKFNGKWKSRVKRGKNYISIGVFDTKEEAKEAFLKAIKS